MANNTVGTKGIKNNYFNLALCVFSFVVLVIYLFVVDDVSEAARNLSQATYRWLFLAVLLMVVYWLLEAYVLHLTIKPIFPAQKLSATFRVSMIGQYFNCITPFASGGQPAQAYFMVKRGIPLGESMSALLTKFIIYQITLTIYCLATLLLRFEYFMTQRSTLMIGVLVGFLIHTTVMGMLIGVAFFKNGTLRFTNFLITFLTRFKVFKHLERKRGYYINELEHFHDRFQYLLTHKTQLIKMCLLTVVQLTAYFLIGNMILRSFHLSGDTITILASQAFVLMITSFVPLPGALLAAEGSFYAFFSLYFPPNLISLALIIWRFITFYFPIIVGLIFTVVEKRQDSRIAAPELELE